MSTHWIDCSIKKKMIAMFWPSGLCQAQIMVTHARNLCSAINPSKVHTQQWTLTHPEQWEAIYAAAPGPPTFTPPTIQLLPNLTLTNKWSIYNFNGRFIWTVRDRITKKIQKNSFHKSYKLISILMSQISIWSPINQQDFWLPGVFYTDCELRLGALSSQVLPV